MKPIITTASGRPITLIDWQKAFHADLSGDEYLDRMAELAAQTKMLKNRTHAKPQSREDAAPGGD